MSEHHCRKMNESRGLGALPEITLQGNRTLTLGPTPVLQTEGPSFLLLISNDHLTPSPPYPNTPQPPPSVRSLLATHTEHELGQIQGRAPSTHKEHGQCPSVVKSPLSTGRTGWRDTERQRQGEAWHQDVAEEHRGLRAGRKGHQIGRWAQHSLLQCGKGTDRDALGQAKDLTRV